MVDAFVEGVEDGFWGLEVHVCHPHWEDFFAGVLLPFLAVGVAAFWVGVEKALVWRAHNCWEERYDLRTKGNVLLGDGFWVFALRNCRFRIENC